MSGLNACLIGDVRDVLPTLPDESVHCVVTSPPYWGLRDYGVGGQIGLESTLKEFVETMVEVFREVRRILRPDGTLWLNLGDSYSHADNGSRDADAKPKDLLLIPARVALALQGDGWWVRNEVIWAKKAPMPESVRDRMICSHEKVFLLARNQRYFYDADGVREETTGGAHRRGQGVNPKARNNRETAGRQNESFSSAVTEVVESRNLRDVWPLGPEPYPEAHFAVFPRAIPERAILAGTSAHGVCSSCGAPWVRNVDVSYENPGGRTTNGPRSIERRHETAGFHQRLERRSSTLGWMPSCSCDADVEPAVVLDPFMGSGTTAEVAQNLGRSWIGVELNPEYVRLQRKRTAQQALGI